MARLRRGSYGGGAGTAGARSDARGLDRLSHILVLYMENRSFDNLLESSRARTGSRRRRGAARWRGQALRVLPVTKGPFHIAKNPEAVNKIEALDDLPNRPFSIVGIRPASPQRRYP